MIASFRTRRLAATLALALSAGLAACDNPVQEEHEEHTIGLIVLDTQNQEVARIDIESTPVVTGQIRVAPGSSTTFRVVGLAEDGDQVPIGGELSLRATVASAAVATAAIQNTDQLIVTGVTAGASTLELALLHEEHEDFGRLIPVVVQ